MTLPPGEHIKEGISLENLTASEPSIENTSFYDIILEIYISPNEEFRGGFFFFFPKQNNLLVYFPHVPVRRAPRDTGKNIPKHLGILSLFS